MKTRFLILLALVGLSLLIPLAFAIGVPPPERVTASSYHIVDSAGNSVDVTNVGKQITLSTDLANAQDKEQFVIYLVEIYDYKDAKIHSGTIEGTLAPQMSFSPTVSWVPENTGFYSVKFKILEDLKTQSALSPYLNAEFHVIREGLDTTKTRQWLYPDRECPEGKQVATKYDKSKNICVFPATLQKLVERGWVATEPEPVRTPPPEPPFEKKEPLTKIEVMFGEKLNDGLAPLIVTEVTTHAETLDEIMVWKFELIGNSGDDRGVSWDFIPKDKRIWYEITHDNGQEIIDYTRMPENWGVPSDQHIYEMDCGLFHKVSGESAHPTLLLIKNNTSTILARNSWMGIYPNSNGDYSFEFASIFEHYVRLPEDIGIITYHETKECDARWQIDGKSEMEESDGYYTKMVFRLE